jgi:hypothetical protein
VHGVFISPTGRISEAAIRPPQPWSIVAAVPLCVVLYLILRYGRVPRFLLLPLALLLAGAFAWSSTPVVFAAVIASMRWVPVIAVVASLAILWNALRLSPIGVQKPPHGADPVHRSRALFLLAALTAIMSLMQYPFAHPLYLWFVAPVAVLTLAGAAASKATAPLAGLAMFAVFYIALSVQQIGRVPTSEPLGIEGASLHVSPEDAEKYRRVVALLREHARGEYIWAGPDTPELYYLADRRNPTRHLFEFLAQRGDPEVDILDGIDHHGVNAVAINHDFYFSHLSDELEAELVRRFPASERVGNLEVRWRP